VTIRDERSETILSGGHAVFVFAEAFVVNRKRREGSHVTQVQTDKLTHTVPHTRIPTHTRTPTPRLGRRDERMERPEGGDKNTQRRSIAAASRCPASRDSPALVRQEGDD